MSEGEVRQEFGAAIIKTDYIVSVMLLAPLAFWGAMFIRRIGGHDVTGYIIAAAIATAVFPIIGGLRLMRLKRILTSGGETVGRISKVMIQGQRGRVEFTFKEEGESYTVNQAVRKSPVLEELKGGTKVRVRFDPSDPSKALLPVIFERA